MDKGDWRERYWLAINLEERYQDRSKKKKSEE